MVNEPTFSSIPRYKDKSEMLSGQFFANRLIPGKN
jgi:hypothetical protein